MKSIQTTSLGSDGRLPIHTAGADDLGASAQRLHVLLAEDHPVVQMLAGLLLGQLGHSHVCVSNGQEALDAHAAHSFDLILMDVMMPVMDGLSAMLAVREREAGNGKRTPIVVVTSHTLAADRDRLLAAGADGYVAKPLTAEALQAEMARVLGPALPR